METQKPLLKDEDGEEVDVHMYRSMIGSLMYLTSSRPDIMFAVCACARYQVNPKVSHLHDVKWIFRLISYQCKKQTVVANSTTEAEYVAASRKAKKTVKLMMEKLFRMELELMMVTQTSVRRDIQLVDEEGVECLPNSTIFEQLALMRQRKESRNKLVQEITKKQKVEDDKETAELKQLMKIIPNEEEVAIDAIPLAVKSSMTKFKTAHPEVNAASENMLEVTTASEYQVNAAISTALCSIVLLCYLFRNPFSSTTMGDENPIRTLGDYSKPSYEGYRNTIELPVGNNVVPLQSDTIQLVQNGCSFHRLRSEDPNQHLKDFLKLMDSLNLEGENRERTRLRLFQFSLRDQASN
ncbi:hypothetical protein Tco_0798031 [Tanacetum coccineum]